MSAEALRRLEAWPRLRIAALPTRLVAVRNLGGALGATPDPTRESAAPELWIKMDAETGVALGGNKVRKLETELGGDRLDGVTHLITTGGPQSNHCRVTAGVAAHLGLGCVLVVNGEAPDPPRGNALLHRLFGADIRTVVAREERAPEMERAASDIEAAGGRALVIPLGASTALGTLGYALAAVELATQLGPAEGRATTVFVSASSCGTLAGLLLGSALLGREDIDLVGVSADTSAADMRSEALRLAHAGAALLGYEGPLDDRRLSCDDSQVGEGYGIPTPATHEAIALFGAREGVVLDPVYTGKAAAGFLSALRAGRVPSAGRAVFVHTGGHPTLLV